MINMSTFHKKVLNIIHILCEGFDPVVNFAIAPSARPPLTGGRCQNLLPGLTYTLFIDSILPSLLGA